MTILIIIGLIAVLLVLLAMLMYCMDGSIIGFWCACNIGEAIGTVLEALINAIAHRD